MSTDLSNEQVLRAIATNLRQRRGETPLSEIANRCGVWPAVISRIELRRHMPGAALLARIAAALECSTEDLLRQPVAEKSKK